MPNQPSKKLVLIKARSINAVRIWTIPEGSLEVWPTPYFYRNRPVLMSNEGNEELPFWVALDRNNEQKLTKRWQTSDLIRVRNKLRRLGEIKLAKLHPYDRPR